MCKIMNKYLVESIVKTAQKYHASDKEIIRDIAEQLGMTKKEAEKALKDYRLSGISGGID